MFELNSRVKTKTGRCSNRAVGEADDLVPTPNHGIGQATANIFYAPCCPDIVNVYYDIHIYFFILLHNDSIDAIIYILYLPNIGIVL